MLSWMETTDNRSQYPMIGIVALGVGVVTGFLSPHARDSGPSDGATGVAQLRQEARVLEPLVESPLARSFLRATPGLPSIAPRRLFLDEASKTYLSDAEVIPLGDEKRRALKTVPLDEEFYYTTKYGSPLAYARAIDLLGRAGLEDVAGRKVLDFGYGTIGHLRLLAGLGADVSGVDVDPLLRALYSSPEDQGIIKNPRGRDGRIRLIHGRFPADEAVRTTVGGHYDLILSKNTLKRGYVHPERPVDPRRLLNLGVDDTRFVRTLYDALKPGGQVLIYNISPAPSPAGQPYKPWADGRCPFPRETWEGAGFRIAAFDRDDSETMRRFGHALGWDRGDSPIDLKNDLFALYSIMEKPAPR
jgi:SAM-dependent methyltransferase